MIPLKIRNRAAELVEGIEAGTVTPRTLKHNPLVRVVDIGMRWRLVQLHPDKGWQVMSHEQYNRHNGYHAARNQRKCK